MIGTMQNGFRKTAIASAVGLLVAAPADAAFSPLPPNTAFRLEINGGCFEFANCQVTGGGVLSDNSTAAAATITTTSAIGNLPPGTYGSGIVGDGLMGVIEFITDGLGNISVASFSQDSYLNTSGGTFYLHDPDGGANMGGAIDGSGNMVFDPTGRQGMAAAFASTLAEQPWNIDDPTNGLGSGVYETFTTGTSTNRAQGLNPPFTVTGTPLSDVAGGVWSGTLVSAGNIGQSWGSFDNTQYSELLNITVTQLSNPVAVDDTASTTQGVGVSIDVLANDNDPEGDTLSIASIDTTGLGAGSTAVINAGQILYTPAAAFLGTESFTYAVSAGGQTSLNSATVTVTVSAAGNTPPVANDDALTTAEDTAGTTVDVRLNDFDADGDPLTVVANTNPLRGTVVDNGDGTFTYTPNANLNGSDTFTYTISDGRGGTDTANVNVTVTPLNDPPVANDVSVVTQLDTPVDIDVLANDSDPDGDTLTVESFTQPANGAVTDNGDNTLKYTPNTGFAGTDQFTYVVSDGNGGTDTATVTIDVISVAYTGPVAPNDTSVSPDVSGGSNFTMINPDGSDIGGTNDLSVEWDGVIRTDASQTGASMNIATSTPTPFFGFVWEATTVRVFGPGTYTFDTCPGTLTNSGGVLGWIASDGSTNCDPSGNNDLTMTVAPNQLGAHMLFNWNQSKAIDVAMVWDINAVWQGAPDGSNNFSAKGATFTFSVIDSDGDGTPGQPMVDGPFNGFNANFNLNLDPQYALPPVNASATQGGSPTTIVVPGEGDVTVTAAVGPGTFSFDWSASDPALVSVSSGTSGSTFVFNPSALPADGAYTARVTITDTTSGLQNFDEVVLNRDSSQTLANASDSDGDGVPNFDDGVSDPTQVQGLPGNSATFLLQASAGQIILGRTAVSKGAQTGSYGAIVGSDDIGIADVSVTDSCVGGCFDFEVIGIPAGSSVDVVVPLSEGIPADAVFRLFRGGQWHAFRATGTAGGSSGGDLASAAGGAGTCPPPGDPSYAPGLPRGIFVFS